MKNSIKHLILSVFFLSLSTHLVHASSIPAPVPGSSVTYTQKQIQQYTGQNFQFELDPILNGNVTNGTFTITAKGDYSPIYENHPQFTDWIESEDEFISWDIDNIANGVAGPSKGGDIIRVFNPYNKVLWTQSFSLSDTDLLAIVDDAAASIFLDLSEKVHAYYSSYCFCGIGSVRCNNRWVEIELNYELTATPVPASALLFISAFIAFTQGRRIRSKRKSVHIS